MLIPRPHRLVRLPGRFPLGPGTALRAGDGAQRAAALLRGYLGLDLPVTPDGAFVLALDPALRGLGAEGYGLTVGRDGVLLRAPRPAGLLHGVQTVRRLAAAAGGASLPCVQVSDRPRFGWRGVLLDVARHFLPVGYLRDFVDRCAGYKLNVLHLHLTDDQGWRLPVAGYPLLTEVGGWRKQTVGDGVPHGGAYTPAELRSLVAYAAERGITVMPEIELPGHARAALAAYPHLGNVPGRRLPVWERWGVCENIFGVHDEVFDFLRTVLGETLDLFDSPYVHIGGDECPTAEWETSPAARERARAAGLAGPRELHGWFLRRAGRLLLDHGRTPVCWAETGAAGMLPREFTVMPWRDAAHGLAAARRGHDVVMTPHRSTYLDYPQSDDPAEPAGQQPGTVTLADVYAGEPAPADWEPAAAARVLGTQAQLWTEYAPTPAHVDHLAFPRLAALAETAWSHERDLADFRRRVAAPGTTPRTPTKEERP
ncbi:beta-N-acetylhexosaminidase [Streptomyces sp. MAR4 CNX-425]|uniref:beta-N-acetylhexosaminidase n=1 Tax=Streptomyces sp. MAR4 CNX-425 TaxID=3406343 RepID=UPI003B50B3E4